MFSAGDKPGKGEYKCTNCGNIVELEADSDALPPCPRCGNKEFEKL